MAQTLAAAVRVGVTRGPAAARVRVTVVELAGHSEPDVLTASRDLLSDVSGCGSAFVTWGSGPVGPVMGVLTALSERNLPWQLVPTIGRFTGQVLDPLAGLDVDPVVPLLVRWRLFGALDELARAVPSPIRLTAAQAALVAEAACRRERGLRAEDSASMLTLVADALARRDGTLAMAVRRYITRRYEDLLEQERAADRDAGRVEAPDLLTHAAFGEQITLGPLRARITTCTTQEGAPDAVLDAARGRPSREWLVGRVADALQKIGRGSHQLARPTHDRVVAAHLRERRVDGEGWETAQLPQPMWQPATSVLAVWAAGNAPAPPRLSVAEQLVRGMPDELLHYLDPPGGCARVRALVVGTSGPRGSLPIARSEADLLNADPLHSAGTFELDLDDPDRDALRQAIERRISAEIGALLLVPTGNKQVVLPLVQLMRQAATRRGVPLFVRENGRGLPDERLAVHLWPALTGGDLPVLVAARECLVSLELDVAWRLLAASGAGPAVVEQARNLATAFTCRHPLQDEHWPEPGPAPTADPEGRTFGLAAQRLALIRDLPADPSDAGRVRQLVLAADVLEASVIGARKAWAGTGKNAAYKVFRDHWEPQSREGGPRARDAQLFLLLNSARDAAPITHGTGRSADAAVDAAATALHRSLARTAGEQTDLPRDVATLLQEVVAAAERLLGRPMPGPGQLSLSSMHGDLIAKLSQQIAARQANPQLR